jgi:DNA-binding LytR/AlgR family response regulator
MKALQGRRVLVVEDEYLIAQEVSDILEEAGAIVLGPIGWLDEALTFVEVEGSALTHAVLDVSLHERSSYPIADALKARGVRFVFITGYDGCALAPAYRDFPRCEKPLRRDAIVAALNSFAS